MPPSIALFLSLLFSVCLIIWDVKRKPPVSWTLLIPFFWFLLKFSGRPLSMWLNMMGFPVSIPEDHLVEGSPVERNFALVMFFVGLYILSKRKIDWEGLWKNNIIIVIYLLYLALSTLWSDYTFISFKRWSREIINITMILIILSEPSPVEAIKTIIKRSAYILAPLSIVFIKYFPYGKRYSDSGMQMLTGVTLHKNTLGMMCLFFGIFFIWNLLVLWRQRNESNNFKEVIVHGLLIIQIGWLLHLANSATSIVGVIIGIIILIGLRKFKNNIKSLKYFLIFIVFFALVLNLSLDLSKIAFSGLEREETLTGRTNIWQKSLEIAGSPLIGVGYMSFWQSESRQKHFEMYAFRPTQAHNGYLETYLTLGLIGLALLLAILFSAIKKIKQRLVRLSDFDFQVLSMAYLLVMMLVNITEATFQGTGMFWSMALFISINCPQRNNGPFAQKAAGYGE